MIRLRARFDWRHGRAGMREALRKLLHIYCARARQSLGTLLTFSAPSAVIPKPIRNLLRGNATFVASQNNKCCNAKPGNARRPNMASVKFLRRQAEKCAELARRTHDDDSRQRCEQLQSHLQPPCRSRRGKPPILSTGLLSDCTPCARQRKFLALSQRKLA